MIVTTTLSVEFHLDLSCRARPADASVGLFGYDIDQIQIERIVLDGVDILAEMPDNVRADLTKVILDHLPEAEEALEEAAE